MSHAHKRLFSLICSGSILTSIDIRRTGRRPGDLLLDNQLRHFVLGSAIHSCYLLRLVVHFLWHPGCAVGAVGYPHDDLGEDMAS